MIARPLPSPPLLPSTFKTVDEEHAFLRGLLHYLETVRQQVSTRLQAIDTRVVLTDAATVAVDASQGNHFDLSTAASRTIDNPTNLAAGSQISFTIRNTSGGAIVTTWASNYALAGAWVDPAAAKQRSIRFEYDGTKLYEVSRTAADVTT